MSLKCRPVWPLKSKTVTSSETSGILDLVNQCDNPEKLRPRYDEVLSAN